MAIHFVAQFLRGICGCTLDSTSNPAAVQSILQPEGHSSDLRVVIAVVDAHYLFECLDVDSEPKRETGK